MAKRQLKTAITLYLLCMAFMHVAMLWKLRGPIVAGYGDFEAFYTAGQILQQGNGAALYNVETQWQVQQKYFPAIETRQGPLPYIRPPFEALLFLPFAHLQYFAAFLLWTLLNTTLLVTIPFLLIKASAEVFPFPSGLSGMLSLGLFPIAIDLIHGQDAILLLFLLTLTFIYLQQGEEGVAGCFLAAGLFKFHLVIPIALVFLLRRRWRLISGFTFMSLMLLLVSWAIVGKNSLLAYPGYVWNLSHSGGKGITPWQAMPNLHALVTAILGNRLGIFYINSILGVISLLVIWLVAARWGSSDCTNPDRLRVGFSLAVTGAILVGYYASSYDLTLLLLPIYLLTEKFIANHAVNRVSGILFAAGIFLLLMSPLHWVVAMQGSFYYFLGGSIVLLLATSFFLLEPTES